MSHARIVTSTLSIVFGLLAACSERSPEKISEVESSLTTTLVPEADAEVNDTSTTTAATNYGTTANLYTDGSPFRRSYLRFNAALPTGSTVQSATLRVYADTSSSVGYEVHSVSDITWGETTITYNNAPAFSTTVSGTSGAITGPVWTNVDITSLVSGTGKVSIVILTTSSTNVKYDSREGVNPPQLVINYTTSTVDAGVDAAIDARPIDAAVDAAPDASTGTTTTTLHPEADSEVNDTSTTTASTNYGTAVNLYTDGSPFRRSYLRFDATLPAGSAVQSAVFRVYADTSSTAGYEVHSCSDITWGETTITYNNAPAFSSTVTGTSGSFTGPNWTSVDITPLVNGTGKVSVVILTTSSTNVKYDSREGTHPPELIVTYSGSGGATPPVNTVPPSITGATSVGSTLTAQPGTWTGTAPITYAYQWRRCDSTGAGCVDITGATATTYVAASADVGHTLRVHVTATNSAGSGTADSAQVGPITSGLGICNSSGTQRTPPATFPHVILIMMENKSYADVMGNANAPYFNSIKDQCGYSQNFVDNMFSSNLVSLPHYLANTSGSNCNSGLGSTGSGCITDDGTPGSHKLSTTSLFNQVASYKAYMEGMPSNCALADGGTSYAVHHNPVPYYTAVTNCTTFDIPITAVTCPTTTNQTCGTPNNVLTQDLANDTLPQFAWVTPNLQNDMHDGTVAQGDNWLHTYLPLIFNSPAYQRGDVAVYVMWDEQATSTFGGPQPNAVISPYTAPTISTATMNLFAVLRSIERQLAISTFLGCASGTIPGGGTCPTGSTADLRAVFNF